MEKILIPANSPEGWKRLHPEAKRHRKPGHSAWLLAHCWQPANDFPAEVHNMLMQAEEFRNLEMLLVFPEHKVLLPGGSAASQNDIWVLARCDNGLVSITVEGKVAESFGPTVAEWSEVWSQGKQKRLSFFCSRLMAAMATLALNSGL